MCEAKQFWNRKSLVLITGASQGIGQYWAIEFSKQLAKDSVVILWARSVQGLEETKKKVLVANPNITVKTHPIDLSTSKAENFSEYFKQFSGCQFDLNLLVNNAGSIGDVGKFAVDMTDEQEWQRYLALNLVSFTTLTSTFVKQFTSGETTILNVTSLAAVQPMPSLALYCVGKASREMFLKVLALENPILNILNYSPGPIHTDMVNTILASTTSSELKKGFTAMKEDHSFVTLHETTEKVMKTLEERKYESGGRVDFYDC